MAEVSVGHRAPRPPAPPRSAVHGEKPLPIEEFIQALSSQLDRAQTALRLKARNLPLTFAVRDLSIDLRAHFEVIEGAVCVRSPSAGETDTSILHLAFTTITRPVIEENTMDVQAAIAGPSLRDVLGDEISEEEQRRLEWTGIQTVSQLRDLDKEAGENAIARVTNIPALRLREALDRASRPRVTTVQPVLRPNQPPQLYVRGFNLMQDGNPVVHIEGQSVHVLRGNDQELWIAPLAHHTQGTMVIEPVPGQSVAAAFSLSEGQSDGLEVSG